MIYQIICFDDKQTAEKNWTPNHNTNIFLIRTRRSIFAIIRKGFWYYIKQSVHVDRKHVVGKQLHVSAFWPDKYWFLLNPDPFTHLNTISHCFKMKYNLSCHQCCPKMICISNNNFIRKILQIKECNIWCKSFGLEVCIWEQK